MSDLIHVFYSCHHCGAIPIVGTRHHCNSCPAGPDNDLCPSCHQLYQQGKVKHPGPDTLGESAGINEHRFETFEGKPPETYQPWLAVPLARGRAPQIPDGFVVRPIFASGFDSTMAGYAFAAVVPGRPQPLLLTALHVMDEMIKLKGLNCSVNNPHYTGLELPREITKVDLFDVFAPTWMMAHLGEAQKMLVLPHARTDAEEPDGSKDIAAFTIPDTANLRPLPLATQTPEVGAPVWLAAVVDNVPGKSLVPATVVEKTAETFIFMFHNPAQKASYSSGAPILNEAGEIVAVNVGGGALDQDHHFGHGNHAESILNHLNDA